MSYIKSETIDKVFEAADLIQVIGDFVSLKKKGANYMGISPFVDEKTPSFSVSPAKGIWKDFSSGKSGNNAVSFLMEKNGFTYPEAIEWLAKKYGITIEYDNSDQAKIYQAQREKKEALRPLMESTIRQFENEFHNLPEDHPAKIEVYQHRGYSKETAELYRIGYAPGGKFIYDKCVQAGRLNDAKALGLISDKGDKWHDRIIYPLIDAKGNARFTVGLAGRRVSDNNRYAKWMNSQESDLYQKNSFWYGLNSAREAIVKQKEVWIVEGYNDVISFQVNGIENVVASCGTAITRKQIKILKKLCDRIVFCFDPDDAGRKAMLQYIPEFIRLGFRVQMVFLYPAVDPDDFVRFWKKSIDKYGLEDLQTNNDYRDDGFKFLMDEKFANQDSVGIAQATKELARLIGKIEDEAMQSIYTGWLQKESGLTRSDIKGWAKVEKEKEEKKFSREITDAVRLYEWPESLKEQDINENLIKTVQRYQMFMANNQIWVQSGDEPPYKFKSVSNFAIEIIQHMDDEKFPMKLVRIRNVHKQEKIFDMPSTEMNQPNSFENAVTNHGNFRWKGGRKDHELLKTYLFDQMGSGRKIDVLGWQPEGFWVWNNKITVPNGEDIAPDANGVFEKDKVSYYVPSANQIYRNNPYKYEAQKKVECISTSISFQNYANQMLKVHRNHGLTGILFAVASMFQDIVVSDLNFFPMLFLFGPASSGKDQLADACQSFFGHPQTAINLEGGVSTIKAQVREFAQFSNLISQLSEYKPGDPKLDGVLKGLWDRRGYKRGNIDSHVGTESIPILSSVLMTGNYAPDQEALITRFIWEFMDKTVFSDAETKEYELLEDMTKKGISAFTGTFLKHRDTVKNNFKYRFREFKATLTERRPEAVGRMISNISVLGTFYQIFQNIVNFPFTHQQMMEHFEKTIDSQMRKMNSASTINRWWDCFLASMRGNIADQIRVERDFKIEGNQIYFNFTSCYNRVQRQWYVQYRDASPSKSDMMNSLKKDKSWSGQTAGTRMGSGRATSAYIVNLTELPVQDEILSAVEFQMNEHSLFSQPPATPEENKNNKNEGELPF